MTQIFSYGPRSEARLRTCHDVLQAVCRQALKISPFDLTILEGHRDEEAQNAYFADGKSKLKWPESKHNSSPSLAVDIAPYPVRWENTFKFYVLGGLMFAAAEQVNLKQHGFQLRWGGDWDGDWTNRDQRFYDLPHFELKRLSSV